MAPVVLPALPKRCGKPCAKAVISHGGPSSASAVAGLGPRAAAFRTDLNGALAREDLGELYRLWDRWTSRDLSDVPLDTREFNVVRRRAAHVARDRLRHAVRGDSSLDKALEEADAVETRWPYAIGVKISLEYKAALKIQQEREELKEKEPRSEPRLEKPLAAEMHHEGHEEEEQSTAAGSEPDEEAVAEEIADELVGGVFMTVAEEEAVAEVAEEGAAAKVAEEKDAGSEQDEEEEEEADEEDEDEDEAEAEAEDEDAEEDGTTKEPDDLEEAF